MKIGDIVKLKVLCLANPINTLGYVYDEYPDFDGLGTAISVIFKNGSYDGFSVTEQPLFLEYVKSTDFKYNFTNGVHLLNDFENGYFNDILA
ncbi:MAG: hypothetical protein M0R17_03275 [Candidatus Omnitrophica bacterium]|jgi:hypothetical protein|nr:hypothetical protein [Candidatus Omnitrophota bacterium]